MVPEVQDQGRIDASGVAQAVIEVKTDDFLKWKPTVPRLGTVVMRPKLIGLHGRARSGKDTIATLLAKHHPIQTISFAEPIRDGLRGILGLTEEHFHGSLKEVPIDWLGKSPRQLMQSLGTEWGRGHVHEDIWLLLAQRTIERLLRYGVHVVVTDVRFDNEATMIRNMNGSVWHVYRPGPEIASSGHASEAGLSTFDARFDLMVANTGTLEELEETALEAFEGSCND